MKATAMQIDKTWGVRQHYMAHRNPPSGFTLIEMMIALTLGALLIAAVTGIFLSGNKSYREDNRFARMEESGRFAMKFLVDDISMAGFWGRVSRPTTITSAVATTPCGIAVDANTPINILHAPTAAAANTAYPCITAGNFQQGGDVLAVKRVQGAYVTAPPSTSTNVYLRTVGNNPGSGELLQYAGTAIAGSFYWNYIPRIYYIRNYSVTPGDGIPTLVRQSLSALSMTEEPLVDGIEGFEIEFGIDDTIPKNWIADRYVASPSAADLENAVSVRVYVLARSLDKDAGYLNTKTYNAGSTAVTFNDSYHRRMYTTTVALRNPRNVARLP